MHFAVYKLATDTLTVLKVSYPDELFLTSKTAPSAPKVISVVAYRWRAVLQGMEPLQRRATVGMLVAVQQLRIVMLYSDAALSAHIQPTQQGKCSITSTIRA